MFNKKAAPAASASSVPTAPSTALKGSESLANSDPIADESVSASSLRPYEASSADASNADDASRNAGLGLKPTSKPSILSNGFEFEGVIKSDGVLNISSSLKGKVFAKSIFLDVDGIVEGEIQAEVLTIKGKIYGEIHCQDLTIGSRAVIDGTCFYKTINIQRGGRVSGKLTRVD
jgi:cytoskeletal protein CcmA (bactofilin family)